MGGTGGAKPSHGSIGGRANLRRKGTKFHIGPELMYQKCSISIYSTPELVSGHRDPGRNAQRVSSRKPQWDGEGRHMSK